MVEYLRNRFTSEEKSNAGPALAEVGGRLFIAWRDEDDQICIMPSIDLPDGRVGFERNAKVTIPNRSDAGPALSRVSITDDKLVVAWVILPEHGSPDRTILGDLFDTDLNHLQEVWSLGTMSASSPALTWWVGGNGVNLAWTRKEDKKLAVTQMKALSDPAWGVTSLGFDSDSRTVSTHTSPFEPALANSQWPDYAIHMAWTGEGDGTLNYMSCINSNPFDPGPSTTVFDPTSRREFTNEFSDSGPGMCALGRGLYITWRGSGNRNINLMHISAGNHSIVGKDTSAYTTAFRPAIAAARRRLFIAWTDESGHLNLAHANPYLPTAV